MFRFVAATVGILVVPNTSLSTKLEAHEVVNVLENHQKIREAFVVAKNC